MKCVKIVGPKKLIKTETNLPSIKENKIIFKTLACGICGSDLHNFNIGAPENLILGHEFCGLVVDPGNRKDLKVGDRITALPVSPCGKCDACLSGNHQYCSSTWKDAVGLSLTSPGAYAEYSSCLSEMAFLLPDNVSDSEGALVEPLAVSLHAINLANIKIGESVLVIGGGIIGLLAAELSKLNGAGKVILLETNKKRGEKSLSYGFVDEYYDVTNIDTIKILKEKYNGFDKVIECCGNSGAITEAISLVKNGGRVVLVGVSIGTVDVPLVSVVMNEITLQGAIAYTKNEFLESINLISQKKVNVLKYIDKEISLDLVNETCLDLTSGSSDLIKVIIKP